MTMVGDDSEGTDIIQFGLAKKSQDVLINHMKGLANLESSIKSMVKPGANGAFSGKFLQIAEQQLIYQRDMAAGIRQLNIAATRGAGLVRQQQQMYINAWKDYTLKVGNVLGSSGAGRGSKSLGDRIWNAFEKLGGMMKGMFKGMQKIWDASLGKVFKKTGSMGLNKLLGLGGATIIGALVGKMISSSPLLQAMFKILNTSLTLIMRPIGDFFGAFFRPMFIYFLKEVAIPFFQKGRGWMQEGEKWGRIAVGFFIDPIQAIKSGALLAFKEVPLFNLLASANAVKEAEFFQKDPAAWLRASEGLDPLPAFMGLGAAEQIQANIEEIGTMEEELVKQTVILEEIKEIEADLKATIQAGADPKYAGMSALEVFRSQYPGYSNLTDEMIQTTHPWTQENIGSGETIFTRDAATQQAIVDAIDESLGNLKEETGIAIMDRNPYGTFEDTIYNFVRRIVYEHKGDGPIEWLAQAWEDFWSKDNTNKFAAMDPLSRLGAAFLPSVAGANEPFDEAAYHAQLQLESFESITRSFDTMEDYNQQSAESAQNFFFNVARNQMSTAQSIDLSNKGILQQYDMTAEELYANADAFKERLYSVYKIYEAIGRNADLISYNDQVNLEAATLRTELNLDYTEEMINSTTAIKFNFGKMADIIEGTILDIARFQYINASAMQEATRAILTTTDDVVKVLTGESGTLATQYNKMVATTGGILSTPQLAGGSSFMGGMGGIGGSQPIGGMIPGLAAEQGIGGYTALDLNYMLNSVTEAGEIMSAQDIAIKNALKGVAVTPTGKFQEFFKYEGPEGQSFDQMWKVPKITGPTGALIMDPNWRKVADAENSYMAAIGYANASAASKLNEAAAAIKAGTDAFTTANESAIYVAAGGGLAGLAAVESMVISGGSSGNLPGVTTVGPSYGSWMVSQGGALGQAIKESQAANPAGWAQATGIATSYFSGGGGSGQGGNYSGSSNPGAAAAAAGYSTGSATNAQFGGIIDEPIVGIGMHSGREWRLGESGSELVTPLNQIQGGGGLGNIIIHIGNISKEADYMKLKPLIQRWILEASSRRGMV